MAKQKKQEASNVGSEESSSVMPGEHTHDHQAEMYEHQFLNQQMQQLQQTFATLQKHREELRRLESNIEDISKLKGGENTLIPLGSGIYIKGKVDKSANVLMNVGSGVVIEKDYASALDTIRKQLAEVENYAIQVEKNLAEVSTRLQELTMHLQAHQH